MAMLDTLKSQADATRAEMVKAQEEFAQAQQDLEKARAHAYRCDGALQLLLHLIADLEGGTATAPETFHDSQVDPPSPQ